MNSISEGLKRILFYLFERFAYAGFISVFIYTATQSLLVTSIFFILLFWAFIVCDD
jgi:hypothetical protein